MKFVCEIAKIDRGSLCDFAVAPHAGAWVEISCRRLAREYSIVAPHAGVVLHTKMWYAGQEKYQQ